MQILGLIPFFKLKHGMQIFGVLPLSSYKTTLKHQLNDGKWDGELTRLPVSGWTMLFSCPNK